MSALPKFMDDDQFIPHHSVETEQSLLAAMLNCDDVTARLLNELDPEDFYNLAHQLIFIAMRSLRANNMGVDMVTVSQMLKDQGNLDKAGGRLYVTDLGAQTPYTKIFVPSYVTMIKDKSAMRGSEKLAQEIMKATRKGDTPQRILSLVQDRHDDLTGKLNVPPSSRAGDLFGELDRELEEAALNPGVMPGLQTNFYELDNVLRGLRNGSMNTIAGRPGMAKTSLALNITHRVACWQNLPVAFFSLEMYSTSILLRLASIQSGVSMREIEEGGLANKYVRDKYEEAKRTIGLSNLHIFDPRHKVKTVSKMRAHCKRLKLEGVNLRMIVLDYIQLLDGDDEESRNRQIESTTRDLHDLALELGLPIITISQLSRKCEERADKRPKLSDLRDSGGIEQDSDTVTFIYRDEYYNSDSNHKGIAEIHVAKNRWGEDGTIELTWRGETQTFDDKDHAVLVPQPKYEPPPPEPEPDPEPQQLTLIRQYTPEKLQDEFTHGD